MTAEIGVMNRLGVALAADSAVTIGGDTRKVFSSADKLFQLAMAAPVGIMIYGNASFIELPWEMVIKVFRTRLGTTTHPHLVGYAEAFVTYLKQQSSLFTPELELASVKRLVSVLLYNLRQRISDSISKKAEAQNGLDAEDLPQIIADLVSARHDVIVGRPFLEGFVEGDIAHARDTYGRMIDELLSEIFGSLPMRPETREAIIELALHALVRRFMGPSMSGIVIAGFGEDEYVPSLIHYHIEEKALSRVRLSRVDNTTIAAGTEAAIVPFAQSDAASTFLEGIAPQLQKEMQASVNALFDGTKDAIIEELREENADLAARLDAQLTPALQTTLARLFVGWSEMRERFWSPVLDMVEALPKDELAAAAEALVNLTKFRRRVTPVHESVGGPIDVALITKGDGFVWVKRKHYFSPELNPRAIGRLHREN